MAPSDAAASSAGQGEGQEEEVHSHLQPLQPLQALQEEQPPAGRTCASKAPQYAAAFTVDVLHLIYGLGIGWPAIALPALALSEEQQSWLAASLYIAAVPSMPIYGALCERWGRKFCGYAVGALYLLSALLLAAARSSFPLILASRVLLGLGSGGIFVLAPLYVAEAAEDDVRGRLGALLVLTRSAGILVAFCFGAFASAAAFERASPAFPVLFLCAWFWMPESPVHLLRGGRRAEALAALRWLRGGASAPLPPVEAELRRQEAALAATHSAGARPGTLRDLLATRGSRKAVLIGVLLSCDQQISGFYGIMSYTFMFFEEASPALRDWSNVIVGCVLVGSLCVCIPLYDKVARRTLLLCSNAVMLASLLALSGYYYAKAKGREAEGLGWLPVAAMATFVLGNSVGAAALPIVILTEIFSPKVRNVGLTTNGLFTWFIIFLVTKTFPSMTHTVGFHGACWFYGAWCVLGMLVTVFLLPETRNRPLEDILLELEHGKVKGGLDKGNNSIQLTLK